MIYVIFVINGILVLKLNIIVLNFNFKYNRECVRIKGNSLVIENEKKVLKL